MTDDKITILCHSTTGSMSRVTFGEAVNYGFSLIGYLSLVILVGSGLIFVGGLIGFGGGLSSETSEDAAIWFILGALITIMGWLTIVAGMYGVFYKVIADAVNRGSNPAVAVTQQPGIMVAGVPNAPTVYREHRYDDFS